MLPRYALDPGEDVGGGHEGVMGLEGRGRERTGMGRDRSHTTGWILLRRVVFGRLVTPLQQHEFRTGDPVRIEGHRHRPPRLERLGSRCYTAAGIRESGISDSPDLISARRRLTTTPGS